MPANAVPIEDRYAALVHSLGMGYCLLRIEFEPAGRAVDYRFVEANELFEAHTGLHAPVGRSVRELVPGLESFWVERYAQVAASREAIHFEQSSEVMRRTFDVHAFPVGPADAHMVGLLFKDVTQQQAREANRQFLAEVAQVFESDVPLQDIMTSVGARLGDFLKVNSTLFCEIDDVADTITTSFGWTREGEPNLSRTFRISDYLTPEFLADTRARRPVIVADTATDARTDTALYAALNIRAFVTIPYYAEGVWRHFFAVTDAEPRVWTPEELELLDTFGRLVFNKLEGARADAVIRENEARFRSMADAVPQIIWITDGSGRVEFFNRQWSIYTGISYNPETAADVANEVLHPDDIAETVARFQTALETGTTFTVEHRIRSATGEYRWFLVRAEPDFDEATGKPKRFYGASVDIHDRWTAERALAETDRRKDEFLATLAHELRNPLAPIRTGLSLLERNPPPETAARTRKVMARQLAHMVRLIDDLLDISRINSNKIELKREALDIRSVLDEAIETTRPAIDQARHRIFVSVPTRRLMVDADRTRLVQVFGNLLGNAAKYTAPGGRIEVSAEPADGAVLVQIHDNGIGIDPAALGDVFDLFAQVPGGAERAQGGLGIGLSLVKRLVEMHGGSVWAESSGHGSGSTFSVRLPMAPTESDRAESHIEPARPDARPLEILVVDDNVDAAEMMQALLQAEGHNVVLAHSAPEALRALQRSAAKVAFLDIGLPGMDGYELARKIRAKDAARGLTLVALTGWGAEADRQRAFESGFDHHLTKPIDAAAVYDLLNGLKDKP